MVKLEITPTNITYSKNGSTVYKTSLIDKDKLRKSMIHTDYQGFYNRLGGYRVPDTINTGNIPPVSSIYYGIYAETSKIPSPKHVTDTYLHTFCYKSENGLFRFKEGQAAPNHQGFTYAQAGIHICRKYDLCTKRLFLLAGLAKNHLDCDIIYSYHNEVVNNVDIFISYGNWAFLIVLSELQTVNQGFINQLYKKYRDVSIISVNPKKIKKENINGVYCFTDASDEYIFKKTKEAQVLQNNDDNIYNSYLDYDLYPFYMAGIDRDFF